MSEQLHSHNLQGAVDTQTQKELVNNTGIDTLVVDQYVNGAKHLYSVNAEGKKEHISHNDVLEAYGYDPADSRANYALRKKTPETGEDQASDQAEAERQYDEYKDVFSENGRKGNRRATRPVTTIGAPEDAASTEVRQDKKAKGGHRRATRGVTTIGDTAEAAPQDPPVNAGDTLNEATSLEANLLGLGDALKPAMDRILAGGMTPEQWQVMSIEEQLGLITTTASGMIAEKKAADERAKEAAAQIGKTDKIAADLYVEAGGSREQWDSLSPDMKQLYIDHYSDMIKQQESDAETAKAQAEKDAADALTALAAGVTPLEWGTMGAEERQDVLTALEQGITWEQWKVLTPEERSNLLRLEGNDEPNDDLEVGEGDDAAEEPPVEPEDLNNGGEGRWARVRNRAHKAYRATVMTLTSAEYRRSISKRRKIMAPLLGVAAIAAGVGVIMMMRRGEDVSSIVQGGTDQATAEAARKAAEKAQRLQELGVTHVSKGEGYIHDVGDWFASQGVKTNSHQRTELYNYLATAFPDGNFFTEAGESYVRKAGDFGISAPGTFHYRPEVMAALTQKAQEMGLDVSDLLKKLK